MDYKLWMFSMVAVYGVLFISGVIISILSSQLHCSKINWAGSAQQGAVWASLPTIGYGITTYFEVVRSWFANPLKTFGVPEESAQVFAVGYVVMLLSWVMTVWNINKTEKVACNPDTSEMTAFKKKLMAELQANRKLKKRMQKQK